jgi:hypothetical protein
MANWFPRESNSEVEKKINPTLLVYGKEELIRSYNLPVGAHLWLEWREN